MNTIELQSYIETQKKSKQYIETELSETVSIIENLKKNKPIKWHHNAYYFSKRFIFLTLAVISLSAVVAMFLFQGEVRSIYDQYLSSLITEYLNETFGIKTTISGHIESPFKDKVFEQNSRINIKDSLQLKIVNQIYTALYSGVIVILLLSSLLFWYIARLTKKLRVKNEIIKDYYEATLDIADVYREVIEEKKHEIDFLSKIAQ